MRRILAVYCWVFGHTPRWLRYGDTVLMPDAERPRAHECRVCGHNDP